MVFLAENEGRSLMGFPCGNVLRIEGKSAGVSIP